MAEKRFCRYQTVQVLWWLATFAMLILLVNLPAQAQVMDLQVPAAEGLRVRNTGWAHLTDRLEFLLFALDVVLTFLITAAIAYHPAARQSRRSLDELRLPKMLFVYGLIGLTVGFLVIHHGYLIGFVIFGIGGLLRFRTSGESPLETMRMILVTVMGLCVGLDVPGMALMVTAVAWGVFYFLGQKHYHSVEIKLVDEKHADRDRAAIRALIEAAGAEVLSENRVRFKQTVEYLISVPRADGIRELEAALKTERETKKSAIADWHVS